MASSAVRSDASLIASADRTFAREKYRTRMFTVYNPTESSAFIRGDPDRKPAR